MCTKQLTSTVGGRATPIKTLVRWVEAGVQAEARAEGKPDVKVPPAPSVLDLLADWMTQHMAVRSPDTRGGFQQPKRAPRGPPVLLWILLLLT